MLSVFCIICTSYKLCLQLLVQAERQTTRSGQAAEEGKQNQSAAAAEQQK